MKKVLPCCFRSYSVRSALLIMLCWLPTGIYAQPTPKLYSFNWKNASLSKVFKDIEAQTNVRFSYNPHGLKENRSIHLKVDNAELDALIAKLCDHINTRYKIADNIVMIQSQKDNPATKVQAPIVIAGKIKNAKGEPMPGVSIQNKTFHKATQSGADGSFTIEANVGDELVFTMIGYEPQTQTVTAGNTVLNITLEDKATDLNTVVVTALGIKREARALGYAYADVKGDDMKKARETNVINSLAGRVPGLIINQTAGGPAGSSRVIIRGNTEISGNNQPLYVVDGVPIDNSNYGQAGNDRYGSGYDFGDAISAINPDDVETISVLKGPSASALYGSRASHGVILITTKKGAGKRDLGIEFNSTTSIEQQLTRFDDYQYEYGQGTNGTVPRDFNQSRETLFSNWGAKLDPGINVVGYDGKQRPYGLVKNNISNFFRTGSTTTNTVSLTNHVANTGFRLSASDMRNNDIVPGSYMERNTFNLTTNSKFGEKLTIDAKVMYMREYVKNRPALADDAGNIGNNFVGLANTVDQSLFEQAYKNERGEYINWGGGEYRLNPYWVINEMRNTTRKNRIIGGITANYQFTSWLSLQGRINTDQTYFSYRKFSPKTTPGALSGRLQGTEQRFSTTEADFLLTAQKQVSKNWNLAARLGGSISHRTSPGTYMEATDMVVTDNVSYNSFKDKVITDIAWRKQINSFYGMFSVGYKNWLYVDGSFRRDAASTLALSENVYYYPSLSSSFIFTDAFHIPKDVITFGKIRASVAEVGSDTDPFRLNLYYDLQKYPVNDQAVGGISNRIKPPDVLRPTRTRSFEIGTEMKAFDNRVGFELTYYTQDSRDQIVNVPAPVSSGFEQEIKNAGTIQNKGVEILLSGTPVQTKDFNWFVSVNFAHNKNTVLNLSDGIAFLPLSEARWLGVSVVAQPNLPYGTILGYDYMKDDAGNIVLDPITLAPKRSTNRTAQGKGTWDWTGGLNTSLSYKNFTLNTILDIKQGADLYSMTNLFAVIRGSHISTTEGRNEWMKSEEARLAANKTPQEWEAMGQVKGYVPQGVVQTGVDGQGKPIYAKNTRAINPATYFGSYYNDNEGIITPFIYDASYIKVREISLNYSIPKNVLKSMRLTAASIAIVSRNPFIIHKNVPNVDPDSNYNNGNGQGLEYGSLPSRRSWGINLNVKF
ncbi:TonB-linked SusC/RagA family outer membrane protein [Chitinophaga skermanii]|uniref:TonB-linked SusC/RagA family outer membrane protein n=1 Tax=Chitinophaga skermanii TaxID=331697 RepID=A0A327R4P2_9BACT|nr:SusC/RagA family TonB-linked outer membrane protein [Chitinophaga skermanii]RAJ10912.1 TonB-linked SusC/RagA family outer membrane protein [Chitinophaga skermanii]